MTVAIPETARLTKQQARQITDRIKRNLEALWADVISAWDGEADLVLGYESWQAYCSAEFDSDYLKVPRAERPRVVAMLREHGMTQRDIAHTVNVDVALVNRDLRDVDYSTPAQTRGIDGKWRKTREYSPKPEPEPKPAVDQPTETCGAPEWDYGPALKNVKEWLPVLVDSKRVRDSAKDRKQVKNMLIRNLKLLEKMDQE